MISARGFHRQQDETIDYLPSVFLIFQFQMKSLVFSCRWRFFVCVLDMTAKKTNVEQKIMAKAKYHKIRLLSSGLIGFSMGVFFYSSNSPFTFSSNL